MPPRQTSTPIDPTNLSLEQMAGQLLMAGFPGTAPGEEARALIQECYLGAVCLFLQNCTGGPSQVRALTAALQDLAATAHLPGPLVAIDQEGGLVTRLRHPFAVFPSQMAQAATGNPRTAYRVARAMAREMRAVGIHWDFAPVLDVNNNASNPVIGGRSFGSGPAQVAEFGVAALTGYRDGGVVACGKHFPGHGDTHVDSHLDLPTVNFGWERLEAVELIPFRAAIAAGIPTLMTAHIRFPAVDDLPATLSAKMLEGVLRQRLGFGGLIITDALNMKAIADAYGPGEATVRAIQAGADMALTLFGVEDVRAAYRALVAAVRDGTIPERRFQAAVERVLSLKRGIAALPPARGLSFPVATHQILAQQVAANSVTVTRDQGVLPIRPASAGRVGLIDFSLVRYSQVEEARKPGLHFQQALTARLPQLRGLMVDSNPSAQEVADVRALAESCDTLILVVRNAGLVPAQADLVRWLVALGKPTVVYAARLPYDLMVCPQARCLLTTYGDPPCSLDAAAAVILGDAKARGGNLVS
ncbi:MAG: glycoside hydrolase family 3 protein [Chloroflexota bacterium]|nr:glycoside hydrolase family 3 protein [Chloroflexota bacterium]